MKKVHQEARIENVYQLEGRVPVGKAIPFRAAACAGHVCGEHRTADYHRLRGRLQRSGVHHH